MIALLDQAKRILAPAEAIRCEQIKPGKMSISVSSVGIPSQEGTGGDLVHHLLFHEKYITNFVGQSSWYWHRDGCCSARQLLHLEIQKAHEGQNRL